MDNGTVTSNHLDYNFFGIVLITLRGVRKKSGPGVKSSNFSANIGPTETYYIPNQWKLNKAFAELCRFEIAALIE